MDDEDDIIREYERRKKIYLYVSFLVCLTGAALVAAAMGTQNWVTADVSYNNATDETDYYGDFKGGLFQGKSTFVTTQPVSYDYYTVCKSGECLYSCANTKEIREQHLDLILSGNVGDIEKPPCLKSDSKNSRSQAYGASSRSRRSINANENHLMNQPMEVIKNYVKTLQLALRINDGSSKASLEQRPGNEGSVLKLSSPVDTSEKVESNQRALDSPDSVRSSSMAESIAGGNSEPETEKLNAQDFKLRNLGSSDQLDSGDYFPSYSQAFLRDADNQTNEVADTEGLMSEGLWVGTIACLSGGLLFALVGAIFAIVNTATTPVEAITGVTGLYVWNGLAAGCELVAVILWSVMYNTRLSSNVLVEQSNEGWTTEGNEVLGYSFWLVVAAIIVHIGNCGLIAYGTSIHCLDACPHKIRGIYAPPPPQHPFPQYAPPPPTDTVERTPQLQLDLPHAPDGGLQAQSDAPDGGPQAQSDTPDEGPSLC
ncbi:hypothetical protein FHG87_018500 [Trinorchestia longiramus]|nr:hypothetical protein FHG87_018500 [Trinorchestia longiramus]